MLDQADNFDLAGALSDRSRRGLPGDRSRRPAVNQTNLPETTLGQAQVIVRAYGNYTV